MVVYSPSKTGDCGSPPTPKKPKADAERLTVKEYEERRRRGVKAAWRDEFAWLTYEPAPADSDANGNDAPAATGSEASDGTTSKRIKCSAEPVAQVQCHCVD